MGYLENKNITADTVTQFNLIKTAKININNRLIPIEPTESLQDLRRMVVSRMVMKIMQHLFNLLRLIACYTI